jgi:hypothetical protein
MSGQAQLVDAPDRAIRFNLTLPVTRVAVGPFAFDPVEKLVGAPLADLLEPLRVGPIERRPSSSGTGVEVHPLALPEGEGLALPLGHLGEIALANEGGLLALTVPATWGLRLAARLGTALVDGPRRQRTADGSAEVVTCLARLSPGMRASLPLGTLGEVGVEAARH